MLKFRLEFKLVIPRLTSTLLLLTCPDHELQVHHHGLHELQYVTGARYQPSPSAEWGYCHATPGWAVLI